MPASFPKLVPARLALAAVLAVPGVLVGCGESDAPDDETNPVRATEAARIVSGGEALANAHISTLDPATLVDAEIGKVLGMGPRCEFRYTSSGKPVLALKAPPNADTSEGVVKLNGHLVILKPSPAQNAIVLTAENVRLAIKTGTGGQIEEPASSTQREADLIFEVGDELRVGYRGYLRCVD